MPHETVRQRIIESALRLEAEAKVLEQLGQCEAEPGRRGYSAESGGTLIEKAN